MTRSRKRNGSSRPAGTASRASDLKRSEETVPLLPFPFYFLLVTFSMIALYDQIQEAKRFLEARWNGQPRVRSEKVRRDRASSPFSFLLFTCHFFHDCSL